MLLAVVVLPMMLLLIVFVPPFTWMPVNEEEVKEVEPLTVMEPMVLFAIFTVLVLSEPMPNAVPPDVALVTETEPVPVPLPIVLPEVVPMFAAPQGDKFPTTSRGAWYCFW